MAGYIPQRGDLVHLDFSPSIGGEMRGPHYALVISDREFNRLTRKAIACPITSTIRRWPFEVPLPAGCLPQKKGESTDKPSAILCDQVRSLDYAARRAVLVNHAPEEVVEEVVQRILPALDPQD